MKAIVPSERGRAGVALRDMPRPDCPPGSVRVRRIAASVNRVDLYLRDSGAGTDLGDRHRRCDDRRASVRRHPASLPAPALDPRLDDGLDGGVPPADPRPAGRRLPPRIDSIFPLAKVPAAFGRLEDPARLGKILIRIA